MEPNGCRPVIAVSKRLCRKTGCRLGGICFPYVPYGEFGNFDRFCRGFRTAETQFVGHDGYDPVDLFMSDRLETGRGVIALGAVFEPVGRDNGLPFAVHERFERVIGNFLSVGNVFHQHHMVDPARLFPGEFHFTARLCGFGFGDERPVEQFADRIAPCFRIGYRFGGNQSLPVGGQVDDQVGAEADRAVVIFDPVVHRHRELRPVPEPAAVVEHVGRRSLQATPELAVRVTDDLVGLQQTVFVGAFGFVDPFRSP